MKARARCLLATAWLALTPAAWAVTCEVSAQGVAFGSYDPLSSQSLDSTGEVSVICDASTAYSIALSTGRASYTPRAMASGIHELFYNLYTDATYTTIWGDATAGTATISTTGINDHHTVYGRIPAQQNAFVGSYADTVVVTLTF